MKTGQQSNSGGDNNVGLDVPYHHETNSGDGYDGVLDENKNNEGGKDVCDDANNVGTFCDAENGDGDNSDGIVNNIGGNDSNDVVNPPDSGDAFSEVNSLSGTSPSPRSPSKGPARTPIRWLQLINECATPVDLQKISQSQVNSVFPIIYCPKPDNFDDELNWAPCILKKIEQDQYEVFDKRETFKVSKGLDWDGNEGLRNLWSTFFEYPTKIFLKAFCSQIANGSDDSENSINSSNDGVDDSQSLISVKSLNFDDQINTGAGHDISHNQDKRPFVEDDKSSSTDQSSNDYDSDMDDVGAKPSRGKNAKSLVNLQQRTLPTAKNRSEKTPKVAPQYKSSSESDSDNNDVGAQPPRGKNGKSILNEQQRIVPAVQNLGSKTPRLPPQHKYHSVFQTIPCHLLAKD